MLERIVKGAIILCCAVVLTGISQRAAEAQATACDSPCKVMRLPLIAPQTRPVPNSNPLSELQGKIDGANRAPCDSPCKMMTLPYQVPRGVTVQDRPPYVVGIVPDSTSSNDVRAQGTTCDSPCKIMHLPLVIPDPRGNFTLLTDPIIDLQLRMYKPYMFYQVDTVAKLLSGTRQTYPTELLESHTNGLVIGTIIVDSLGRAVSGSMQPIYATNEEFAAAARFAMPTLRYAPAWKDGHRVAQLVRQNFDFVPPR